MDLFAVTLALALPWVLGVALMLAGRRRASLAADPGALAWTAGAGWFVGALLLTLWMRVLSLAGVKFGLIAIAGPLLLAAIVPLAWWFRRERTDAIAALFAAWSGLRGSGTAGVHRVLWFLLLGWMSVRALLMLAEISLRPLYPWEAWTQWATKARVYFELGTIVPFAGPAQWSAANGAAWFDAGPHARATVPLLQAWMCTAIGRYDDVLMNVPWWATAVALLLALFGALRSAGTPPLAALTATWLAGSLPLLDTHVALAGYADLFLAGYFTLAALAALRYRASRAPEDLATAVLFAAGCVLVKSTGAIWLAVLVPGLAAAFAPRHGGRIAAILFGGVVLALVVVTRITVTVAGQPLHLDFAPQWASLAQVMLLLDNWHLLWYAVPVVLLFGWRVALAPDLRPLTLFVAGGLLYAFVVFAFPSVRSAFGDFATVNRTVLVIAPLACILVVEVVRAWSPSFVARVAPPAPAGT